MAKVKQSLSLKISVLCVVLARLRALKVRSQSQNKNKMHYLPFFSIFSIKLNSFIAHLLFFHIVGDIAVEICFRHRWRSQFGWERYSLRVDRQNIAKQRLQRLSYQD